MRNISDSLPKNERGVKRNNIDQVVELLVFSLIKTPGTDLHKCKIHLNNPVGNSNKNTYLIPSGMLNLDNPLIELFEEIELMALIGCIAWVTGRVFLKTADAPTLDWCLQMGYLSTSLPLRLNRPRSSMLDLVCRPDDQPWVPMVLPRTLCDWWLSSTWWQARDDEQCIGSFEFAEKDVLIP